MIDLRQEKKELHLKVSRLDNFSDAHFLTIRLTKLTGIATFQSNDSIIFYSFEIAKLMKKWRLLISINRPFQMSTISSVFGLQL